MFQCFDELFASTSGKCHSITNLPVALTNLQVESPKTMWALRLVIGPCGAAAMGLYGVRGWSGWQCDRLGGIKGTCYFAQRSFCGHLVACCQNFNPSFGFRKIIAVTKFVFKYEKKTCIQLSIWNLIFIINHDIWYSIKNSANTELIMWSFFIRQHFANQTLSW